MDLYLLICLCAKGHACITAVHSMCAHLTFHQASLRAAGGMNTHEYICVSICLGFTCGTESDRRRLMVSGLLCSFSLAVYVTEEKFLLRFIYGCRNKTQL